MRRRVDEVSTDDYQRATAGGLVTAESHERAFFLGYDAAGWARVESIEVGWKRVNARRCSRCAMTDERGGLASSTLDPLRAALRV